jgi:hypothetical protein
MVTNRPQKRTEIVLTPDQFSVNDQGAVIVNSSEVSQILKTQESQVRAMANNPDNAAIYVGVVVGGTF